MTDDLNDLATIAAGVFAVVTGVFVGAVIADPKFARECAKEEVRGQGFTR